MKTNAPTLSQNNTPFEPSRPCQARFDLKVLYALLLALMLGSAETAKAVSACPTPATVTQPDGSAIKIVLRGDESFHWHEDEAGFTILKDAQSGRWAYAKSDMTGGLIPSDLAVGKGDPRQLGLAPRILPSRAVLRAAKSLRAGPETDGTPETTAPSTGLLKNLVVLVQFSDLQGTHNRAEFEALLNSAGYTTDGAQGSVKDYYREVSYNTLTVESVVADWVTLDRGFAYYGANDAWGNDVRPREMVQEALAKLKARSFDFSGLDANNDGWVDGLTIIHAGGGEEYGGNNPNYIWSHQWNLGSTVTYDGKSMRDYHTEPERRGWDSNASSWGLTRIGVICHEAGHFLGLPDLYDYGYDSEGVGSFCLMAGGSWNGSGSQPAQMSAWCKYRLGWVTPSVISVAGTYAAPRVEDNKVIYRLGGAFPATEYFLVENRQGFGFDRSLPGALRGLLIWHVDESRGNNNDQSHYKVDLEEASGVQHLELNQNQENDVDYFRQGNSTSFTSSSVPNNLSYALVPLGLDITSVSATGPSMTFTVTDGTSPEIAVSLGGSPILTGQSSSVDFGSVTAGQPGPTRTFTVRNEGSASLSLGAASVPSGFTVVESLWGLLTPGEQDSFTVRMDTTTAGAKTGRISIPNNDSDENPFDFPVSGMVGPGPAEIEVLIGGSQIVDGQTTTISFGQVIEGGVNPTRTFTVRNIGGQTLTVGTVGVPTGYAVVRNLPSALGPNQQDTFIVSLQTTVAGAKTGQITFANNDSDEGPFNFPITGVVSPRPKLVYVDGDASCPNPNGSQTCPYRTFCDGYDVVAVGGRVRMHAGRYVSCQSLLTKAGILEGHSGTVTLAGPGSGAEPPAGGLSVTMSPPRRLPGGSFAMQFQSVPGQRYQILTATNLADWKLWKDFTAEEETVEFVQPDVANEPMRFFKAVMP